MAAMSITSQSENKLCEYNVEIIKNLLLLKHQRNEALELIDKQKSEKDALELEMQKLAYKMQMVEKGLRQRLSALESYNLKIKEAERKYAEIVLNSESLLDMVKNNLQELENIMNKKVGTTTCSICKEDIVCVPDCPNVKTDQSLWCTRCNGPTTECLADCPKSKPKESRHNIEPEQDFDTKEEVKPTIHYSDEN